MRSVVGDSKFSDAPRKKKSPARYSDALLVSRFPNWSSDGDFLFGDDSSAGEMCPRSTSLQDRVSMRNKTDRRGLGDAIKIRGRSNVKTVSENESVGDRSPDRRQHRRVP